METEVEEERLKEECLQKELERMEAVEEWRK